MKRKQVKPVFFVSLFVVVSLIAAFAWMPFGADAGKHSRTVTPLPTKAQLKPASVKESTEPATPKVLPPGALLHTAKKGEHIGTLKRLYLSSSTYMTGTEFESALRQQNPDLRGPWLRPGQEVIVPGQEPQPVNEKLITAPKAYEVRAIYLTGTMAGSAKGLEIVKQWRKLGGNAVVFDAKDSDGILQVPFKHGLNPEKVRPSISNLPKFARFLHSQGMHTIARIAIFRDEQLVAVHPNMAISSRRSGGAWRENGKLVWTDPSKPEVQQYNIALAKFVAESGVDEVQFDYVRFPAEGDQKDALFHFQAKHPDWQRADVITGFVKSANEALKPTGVLFSLDVFGVVAWQRSIDVAHTGQDIARMAHHCDVLSPMIYPSHFFGMDGYAWPGDAPEHFIGESMDRFVKVTAGSGVILRPWLQAFGWKTKTYSPEYIKTQVVVARKHGGVGFLFWNARNDYSKPYAAMPSMHGKAEFMRGDERPASSAAELKPVSATTTN